MASPFFEILLFEDLVLNRQVPYKPFYPPVLIFYPTKSPRLFDIHPAVLFPPSVVRRFADITLGTRRLHRRRLRLFQHPDYFLFTEPTSLHFLLLLLLEQNYTFQLSTFPGSGHTLHQYPCLVVHERRSRTDIVLVAEFDDL